MKKLLAKTGIPAGVLVVGLVTLAVAGGFILYPLTGGYFGLFKK